MLVALCTTCGLARIFYHLLNSSTFHRVVLLVGYTPSLVYTVGDTNKYLNNYTQYTCTCTCVVQMWGNQTQAIKMLHVYETLLIVVCFVIINLIISKDTKTLIALPLIYQTITIGNLCNTLTSTIHQRLLIWNGSGKVWMKIMLGCIFLYAVFDY